MTDAAAQKLQLPAGWSAAEVHAHSHHSDGMVSPEEIVRAAAEIGISVLCITDHDTIGDLSAAVALGRELGVEVVVGEEVTTAPPSGVHIIGLFLKRTVRMGMTIEDTVDAIHDQGGLASVPHPFIPGYLASITPARLERLIAMRRVDAIEMRHQVPLPRRLQRRLQQFYAAHRDRLGAAVGAGDSHFGRKDLGKVVTVFPGKTAEDLRRAIEQGLTYPMVGVHPAGPTLRERWAQQRKALLWLNRQRKLGLVGKGSGPARFEGQRLG